MPACSKYFPAHVRSACAMYFTCKFCLNQTVPYIHTKQNAHAHTHTVTHAHTLWTSNNQLCNLMTTFKISLDGNCQPNTSTCVTEVSTYNKI